MPKPANQNPNPSERELANAIRALAMDAVEKAASGHPGLPMGMADVATNLFLHSLKFDSTAPDWPDRDRFVLSAGHGSMLLYALLHLTGYPAWTIDSLKQFRQWGASAAGHPEFGHGAGIETTTGPLGQGFGNAVGMAIAEAHLRAEFGADLVNHRTYVLASDGDLMEGISHEAAALAGHLRLGRLIVLFDDNQISIDGPTSLSDSTDMMKRFDAYGWRTLRVDGHNPATVFGALEAAQKSDLPSLIACRTIIGFGAPRKQGTATAHGSPLGADEIEAARKALDWPHPPFFVPEPIAARWREIGICGSAARKDWERRFADTPVAIRNELSRRLNGEIPAALISALAGQRKALLENPIKAATRKSSELALDVINAVLPETIGGSADLSGSNNTKTKSLRPLTAAEPSGRYMHYGIREHAMAAAMNGMALHGGIIPYGGTFLVFSDYCRPSIRLAALMKQRVIYVFTHDSIGLGEDGPTHQPIEHLAALRAIPNLLVLRPADAVEASECWEIALMRKFGPSVLALSRHDLPQLRLVAAPSNLSAHGAYVLKAASGRAQINLIASGSETEIAALAQSILAESGIGANLVSMPSPTLFLSQSNDYRESILPSGTLNIAIEAGISQGWEPIIGTNGIFIGLSDFGASAPYKTLYEKFGLTAVRIVEEVRARI